MGGESGVGKSRLLDELRTRALVQGALVLRGQAVSEGGLPYQLWREVMRWLALLADPDDLEASVLKPYVTHLEGLLERARHLTHLNSTPRPRRPVCSPPSRR